jgi:hypothetical protein
VTQSVSETIFQIEGTPNPLHVIDVSGLSHHRNHWLAYFDQVQSILFVASLSCYDQTMAEEEGVNRMVDSLVLFENMVNHKLLEGKNFILFLNKKDIYEKKIKKRNIVDYFPQYKGKVGSASQGLKYFDSKFRDQNKSQNLIITHITCCTDTTMMNTIVKGVLNALVKSFLKNQGLD